MVMHIPVLLGLMSAMSADAVGWQALKPGLELASFPAGESSLAGDEIVTVLRIDPALWDLEMLCASQRKDRRSLTAKEWCRQEGLVAAVNAGMFAQDGSTHLGFLAANGHLNCSKANRYESVAAFGPRTSVRPAFRIFDLDKGASIKAIRKEYRYVVQNLRLIRRSRVNRWSQQAKMWSEVALGEDEQGRALFIFCRSPYSMHDFAKILLSLPLGLVCAQHLDGGPVAQLYIAAGGREVELVGSYDTGFCETDQNQTAWPIPNVIGVRPRPE
jgi:uncharacterized protein YigE (DUF2233 family)